MILTRLAYRSAGDSKTDVYGERLSYAAKPDIHVQNTTVVPKLDFISGQLESYLHLEQPFTIVPKNCMGKRTPWIKRTAPRGCFPQKSR